MGLFVLQIATKLANIKQALAVHEMVSCNPYSHFVKEVIISIGMVTWVKNENSIIFYTINAQTHQITKQSRQYDHHLCCALNIWEGTDFNIM